MNLQRMIVRTLMKLPDSLLVKMAGGEPVVIDGRTMDARTQFLAAQGAKAPSITTLSPAEARAGTSQGLSLLDDAPRRNVAVTDRSIPGPAGSLPVRIYTPAAAGPLPGIVFFHFGGCVIGDLDTCNTFCSMLSDICGAVVMSVEYRLAPEHKFPAAADDALAAYEWALAHGGEIGMNPSRIAVGGDSAGGYLSAVVAQDMKRKGGRQPAAQLLIYPVTDMEARGGSMDSCADCYPLSREIMHWFIAHYLNRPDEAKDQRASPLKSDDLSGLAPAIVITAGFDPLRDQGEAYARKLEAAGVKTTYRCYDRLAHAFTAMTGVVPAGRDACEQIARDLKAALA